MNNKSKIIGNVSSNIKKKKPTVKELLKDLKIDITLNKNKINIKFNKILKPYERNRYAKGHLYDPLNTYKNYIKRELNNKIIDYNNKHKNKIKLIDNNCEIIINIKIYLKPSNSLSQYMQLLCLRNEIKPISKPDNDNFEKTIFDILNKVIWDDDALIYHNNTTKLYSINESTEINIEFNKRIKPSGRLTKEIKQTMTDEEFYYIFKKKKGE